MIHANAERYPVSAQCKILGVPRATYYWMLEHPEKPKEKDPITDDVIAVFKENRSEYGAPKMKRALERRGIVASRRRISRIMRENGLVSTYMKKKYNPKRAKPNTSCLPNILEREFNGYAPHTHIVSDLTYMRVGKTWNYVCLLVDLYNREIVGHAAGKHKNADLVKAAFATLKFSLFDIEVFHTDRGSEFDNMAIDEVLEVFEIKRSLSRKGCPYDNAVVESTNRNLKSSDFFQRRYATTEELQRELNSYVWWYNNNRIHSTLDYMSPVEFREAGLSL